MNTAREASEYYARAAALATYMHEAKGSLGGPPPYERLRESYASGRITLGQFEAQIEVLLRSAA